MWPFPKKSRHAAVKVHVIDRDISQLRLHEFRADEKLCRGMAEGFNNAYLRIGVRVLENEHPGSCVFPPDTTLEIRACHQARCEGYTQALANLKALAVYSKPAGELEATFDEPEQLETPS